LTLEILLTSANYQPHVGGIERFVENLARGLTARGHRVNVLCCRFADAPVREEVEGVGIVRVPATYVLDRRFNVPYPLPDPARLLSSLRRGIASADVVHVQDTLYATSGPALFLARRMSVPTVLTQHVGFVPQSSKALDLVEKAAITTVGRSARLATMVATYNPDVGEWAERTWGLTDVRVLPVGIPGLGRARRPRAEARRSFGLAPDTFVALFVGRDVPKKGLDVFLEAHDRTYDLVAVTDRAVLDDRATFLPFMAHDRLQELLACADAFVLPSEAEGIPLSLQEALAAGLPAVTPRSQGFERYLQPDEVVYIERTSAAVRAALLRLAGDRELCSALSRRSRAAAEREFGLDRFVTAYEDIYAEARSRLARA
jgi:glycosyltransferase involved in cell wall biosynthesis